LKTLRLTTAQALIRYLTHQLVERDGRTQPFVAGCLGIFGHGNLAGIGEALQEHPSFRYIHVRNEQAAVHAAVGYARMKNRLGIMACTSSIGPGATNMVTGAALATINRIPVLLLPGDIFARRLPAPVLQQLESDASQDVSVNDCFKPVSRYWDRINRPEQLVWSLPEAFRVLTSPAQAGAVTLALPQDVQAEAYDFPAGLFEDRVWHVPRVRPDRDALKRAADLIRQAKLPVIVAGGGVIYSEATEALARFVESTGIPETETMAGKGSLLFSHPQSLGAVGVTGAKAANVLAREADLVIGIGTRFSDFTTASKTAFQNPAVRFVTINVAELDANKHGALALTGDARATLEELGTALAEYQVDRAYAARCAILKAEWEAEVDRIYSLGHLPVPSQGEVIGAINAHMQPRDVLLNAAGSAPGDLHKLFRSRDPKSYHVEYGYSCMGYEIPGAMGVKMASPDREVYVIIGDGSYLMMSQDLVTAVQESIKLTVVLIDNHGYASIGGLSRSVGSAGFGTEYRARGKDGQLTGSTLQIDYARNAESLGARAVRVAGIPALKVALAESAGQDRTSVIVVETDREERVPGYESWWDVPISETATLPGVREARKGYEAARRKERVFHGESSEDTKGARR
jgi:3D-(3,5/4)-trihydroxycyclohexane-1,2-dione acylhydrolase (decyclizing)